MVLFKISIKPVCPTYIVAMIQDWRVTNGGNGVNFLSYSTKWIDMMDRGGLFHVSEGVYCFFRQLEEKSWSYLYLDDFRAAQFFC